jgi:hypothetical protein
MKKEEKKAEGSVSNGEEKKKGKSLDEKLRQAKERVERLEAQKQKREARMRAKKNKEERAKDTRRKVLLGAIVLGKLTRGEWTQVQLAELTKELTRDDDRALFGLGPLPAPAGVPKS